MVSGYQRNGRSKGICIRQAPGSAAVHANLVHPQQATRAGGQRDIERAAQMHYIEQSESEEDWIEAPRGRSTWRKHNRYSPSRYGIGLANLARHVHTKADHSEHFRALQSTSCLGQNVRQIQHMTEASALVV